MPYQNDSKVWILWIKNHKPLILKGCSQRAGRISRTAVGKSYAIVYDYIHDQLGRLYTLTKKCVDY